MGVTGLWRLIEPAGKPVPVETLENKVLAVDISIWLHQVVKGYQDAKGAPLPNAHLIGLFQRICKLLYFRIKPVFVFDGAYPELKKETIARRQENKSKYNSESEKLKRELAILLSKKTAINTLLGKQISPKKSNLVESNDDLFKLPELPENDDTETESEDEQDSSSSIIDVHSVDIESDNFKSLPAKEKYEVLVELKDTRKMNSWGRLHELPKKSDSFSDFQMQRLLKRRKVQECLEQTEKEMGESGMSLNELESYLNEEGIDTKLDILPTKRIASSNTTRYLFIENVKQTLEDLKKDRLKNEPNISTTKPETSVQNNLSQNKNVDQTVSLDEADDLQRAIQMSLECVSEPSTSDVSKLNESVASFCTDSENSYLSEEDNIYPPNMASAKAYIMQYTDITSNHIEKIVTTKPAASIMKKTNNVEAILNEINNVLTVNNKVTDSKEDFAVHSDGNNTIQLDDTNENTTNIENEKLNLPSKKLKAVVPQKNESIEEISSDEEFEEVPNVDEKCIPLNLEMGKAPDDDIFADIFNKNALEKENNRLTTVEDVDKNDRNVVCYPSHENDQNLEQNIDNDTDPKEKCKTVTTNIEKQSKDNVSSQNEIKCPQDTSYDEQLSPRLNTSSGEINEDNSEKNQHFKDNLHNIIETIDNNEMDLLKEKSKLDRIGRNITEQMTKEAQELLQIFGIPFIVAPMEAEAQCAFLENVKLTEGTITDDSDIWLFGGKTVYKNFFNQKKHVMQFLVERIERSFNLSREKLILLALLVGSDYTTGVSGVGPVTALEILASFPFDNKCNSEESPKHVIYTRLVAGLLKFKQWIKSGKSTDNVVLKKKLKNVSLTDEFPSTRVVQAYLEPNVDKNKDIFTWGEIDITVLRDYTKDKFGWSQNKLDEVIKPVLKQLSQKQNQKTLMDFFKRKVEFQSLEEQMSKRVKAAVQKMDGLEAKEDDSEVTKNDKTKRKHTDKIASKNFKKKKALKDSVPDCVAASVISDDKTKSSIEIKIPKLNRFQEIIPQREKEKLNLLQNKLKAIEIYRKTKIDKKRKAPNRKIIKPKAEAELSESSSGTE